MTYERYMAGYADWRVGTCKNDTNVVTGVPVVIRGGFGGTACKASR